MTSLKCAVGDFLWMASAVAVGVTVALALVNWWGW